MKRIMVLFAVLTLIITTLLSGSFSQVCGQIDCLQEGSTLWGINQAIQGKVGTFILESPTSYMFSWPIKEVGHGFVFIQKTANPIMDFLKTSGGKGNIISSEYFKSFVDFCLSTEWEKVVPGSLPASITGSIASFLQMSTYYSGTYPTFFAIPSNMVDPMQYIQPKTGV